MNNKSSNPSKVNFVIIFILTVIFFPIITFLPAGTWRWLEGWIFCLWNYAMVFSTYFYMYKNDPELLAERSRVSGSDNQKTWDRFLLLFAYLMAIAWYVVMPLDAKRFLWSPVFHFWLKVLGAFFLLPALYFIFYATAENTFLSTRVRIQSERKQKVISSGVYGIVRHPLYLGGLLMLIGAPLLIGSVVGLIISFVACITLILRILGEEKMLINELEGYVEYARKVKYRLIPFIW